MTPEEKAKAYDEALEKARFYYGNCPTEPEKKKLEKLFPQLCESEDERIRTLLVALVKWAKTLNKRGLHPKVANKMLSYLEKQKGQKSLNISAASEWLKKNVCRYMNSEYNEFHKCVEYDGSIDKEKLINDFEEAMQKEQMLKETVEGEITKDNRGNNVVRAGVFNNGFEIGDKVRINIIKES